MTQRAEGAILDIFRTAIGILKDRVNEEQGADTSPERIGSQPGEQTDAIPKLEYRVLHTPLGPVPHFGIFIHF